MKPLSSCLNELCESEEDSRRALKKLLTFVQWKKSNGTKGIDPEDLPALFYQLTALARKCKGLVESVSYALDRLFTDITFCGLERNINVQQIVATIMHHISFLFTKDQVVYFLI